MKSIVSALAFLFDRRSMAGMLVGGFVIGTSLMGFFYPYLYLPSRVQANQEKIEKTRKKIKKTRKKVRSLEKTWKAIGCSLEDVQEVARRFIECSEINHAQ